LWRFRVDPLAAAILAGMGIRSLGVRPKQVAQIKALFRDLKMTDLEDLAAKALRYQNATEVRHHAKEYLYATPAVNPNN
jgi:signal transduction protein with GAF and PtsI domain